ncbi:MAG: glycosyltransferase [Candidatus Poribacteria bacterium]
MSPSPRVSIIVPTLNCAPYIEETIASVLEQSLADWELLVFDACSTDGTPDAISRPGHPNIRVYVERDEGVAHAWDKGVHRASGDYVMLLCGGDGYRIPTWLQMCVDVMDIDSEVSLVWGVPSYSQEADHRDVLVVSPWDIYLGDSSVLQARQKTQWFWHWLRTASGFPDGNMCVRRGILLQCMPSYRLGTHVGDRLREFYFNFNSRGFLPYGLGAVATFASMPEDRLSTVREPEIRLGMHDYLRWVRRYREQLLEDRIQHVYRDGAGVPIGAIPPLKGRITLEDLLLATADGQLVDGINPGARRG